MRSINEAQFACKAPSPHAVSNFTEKFRLKAGDSSCGVVHNVSVKASVVPLVNCFATGAWFQFIDRNRSQLNAWSSISEIQFDLSTSRCLDVINSRRIMFSSFKSGLFELQTLGSDSFISTSLLDELPIVWVLLCEGFGANSMNMLITNSDYRSQWATNE